MRVGQSPGYDEQNPDATVLTMLLTARSRAAIPTREFALPDARKYPIEDALHARNAIARAAQQLNAGNLSQSEHDEIVRKANAKLVGGTLALR